MSDDEQVKAVQKLHKQFCYQSTKLTEDLMRRAEVLTSELKRINQNVVSNCEISKDTRKFILVWYLACHKHEDSLYFTHFVDLLT